MTAAAMSLEGMQHDIQRKLGRCMLHLQRYERLLKVMISNMALAGPPEQLQAAQERQVAGVRTKTLGTLVKLFTGEHLTKAPVDADGVLDDGTGPDPAATWVSIHSSISMSPEAYVRTKDDLAELVELRNELAHHFIERFNIFEENGCHAASMHLDSCYERIDGYYQRLKGWATSIDEAHAKMSLFVQSKTFENAIVHGINPDGTVCWERSSIVESLRAAEMSCGIEGWTPLDAAIGLICKRDRDQVPTRYGCKTWRQLLKRSGQFEIKSITGVDGGGGQTWYRSRTLTDV